MDNLKVRYHGRDSTVGHRDGAYFETEVNSKKSSTGKEFTAYWLVDHEGNRAPECVYVALMARHISQYDVMINKREILPEPYSPARMIEIQTAMADSTDKINGDK